MNISTNRKERGVVLLTAAIVLVTLTALASAFLLTSVSGSSYQRFKGQEARSTQIAQAGAEMALFELSYGNRLAFPGQWGDFNDPVNNPPILFHGGAFAIETEMLGTSTTLGMIRVSSRFPYDPANPTGQGVRVSTGLLEVTVQNTTFEEHELFFKAIYAGNSEGGDYHLEFTGLGTQADEVDGDIHVEGSIDLCHDAHAHRFGDLSCTGDINLLDPLGEVQTTLGGGGDDSIQPPNLAAQGYESTTRRYRSWDPSFNGDVVHVNEEYAHYNSLGQVQNIKISREGGYFSSGGYYEWNSQAQALPDSATGSFFQRDYQNHFADTFNASDDTRIDQTNNFYLGARNGGTTSSYGSLYGLYGGGHSVIQITPEQNNKVFFVDGNLWADSDGDNHIFIVPGPGVDRVNITIVVKGNIYIGDQIFVTTNSVNDEQYSRNIGGYTSAAAYRMTDPESGIALIAMKDGESYDDLNKNGKYDVGETIIGREDPATPVPSSNNPSPAGTYATGYRGRMEGSGNIVFGDTISGPVGVVEAFMFAENNFMDITADGSTPDQNPFIFGNMTAGNKVLLNRNISGWKTIPNTEKNLPPGWVKLSDGYYYPPGTTEATKNNPFVTYRRAKYISKNKYEVYASNHNPLNLVYDDRFEQNIINLPGLPHATTTHEGTWVPLVWRMR